MSTATYYLGNVVTLTFTVKPGGVLSDPTTISLALTKPNGTTSTVTPTKSSTGVYTYSFTPAASSEIGHYSYVLTTTGPGAGRVFGEFDVRDGQFSLSNITFGDLIDEVLNNLHGHTADLEQLTSLSADITTTDLTLSVDDPSQISRGLIEIDSELLWVKKVDQPNKSLQIAPFGRGFRDTSAAAHTSGSMVMNNPRFPRQSVKLAINRTIASSYPDVFQVLVDATNTVNPSVITYPLPANVDTVLDIQWQSIGPSQIWVPVKRWKFDSTASTAAFPTGKSLDIYDGMVPGQPIAVTYAAPLGQFSAETDTLGLVGLEDSSRDMLVYGACYRLVVNLEASRLQTNSIEQSERSPLVMPGAASSISKYFLGLYSQALEREKQRLQKFFPTRTHLVR